MLMADTWITDITHFLDDTGGVAAKAGPARRIAEHFGAIIAAVSAQPLEARTSTRVRCRRRPGRRPCSGEIRAVFDCETNIVWECPACGDNGLIQNWQGTFWDSRHSGSFH